jgi:molybdopterin synthase catalytic subunit
MFFASLRDRAGTKMTTLEIPDGSSIRHLKTRLGVEFPGLAEALGTALFSINREYAFDDDLIPGDAEVAVFPPVSGGSEMELSAIKPTVVSVTEHRLDLNDLVEKITLPGTGAVCVFTGVVRAVTTRGKAGETEYLDYEAYIPMAEEKIRQVIEEIRGKWPQVEGIAVVQRIGRLYPGTPTVVIACSAPHRDTGVFEAARYGIDRLKEIVPIWKRETGPGGEFWVEGDYFPNKGD